MQEFWIFGYGSLMWRPGFAHRGCEPAIIHGYHRSLCVYSHVHRGTPERPGLVLGLDRGGSCHGMAFQIEPEHWQTVIDYLRSREQVTMVYVERRSTIRLLTTRKTVPAITYVVDRDHRQYAGKLSIAAIADHVRHSQGQSGHNIDYVNNTAAHLRQMGIHDKTLEALHRTLASAPTDLGEREGEL